MKNKKLNELERNKQYWINRGKKAEDIIYGMLCDDFRSISGIPDDFYSAEDPDDRARLWSQYQK